ncbi:MAG: hypothetical protein L6R30_24540, partial [Thermoanaerobaculia bacterium]|nr:hypothetical protein [Thermoanaerobaculia bacterium]
APLAALDDLPAESRKLYETLALSGASFVPDILGPSGLAPERLREALLDLVRRGLVTGDGLLGLRQLVLSKKSPGRSAVEGLSTPVAQLGRHPGRAVLRSAEERVANRFGLASRSRARLAGASPLEGRWSLVVSPSVLGPEAGPGEREETWARLLLVRWGVVCRETLEWESGMRWADVAPVFARMELSGDVRRGEFLEGHGPIQYAAPDTVESLRQRRDLRPPPGETPVPVVVCGADPVLFSLNASPGSWVALDCGERVFELSEAGRIEIFGTPSDTLLKAAFTELQGILKRGRDPFGRPRRIRVETAGERGIVGTPLAVILASLGFTRDGDGYAWRAL